MRYAELMAAYVLSQAAERDRICLEDPSISVALKVDLERHRVAMLSMARQLLRSQGLLQES